ncbi:MAG: alpha/beta hydrolase domain-containing protein [Opitutaceae bacterium]
MNPSVIRAFLFVGLSLLASAEVTRVEIEQRVDVGTTGYEKIVGRIHFAVDPKDAHNRGVVDLDKAPVTPAGRVEFSSDLFILRPKDPAAGNGAAVLEISNRGGKGVIPGFNRGGKGDPANETEVGDGFLLREGFTMVTVGWEFDVPKTAGMMRIELPVATEGGVPIKGVVHAPFILDAPATQHTVTDLAAYAPTDPNGADSRLTVRASAMDTVSQEIPRARWRLNGQTITLEGGFEPGKTYEVFYQATNPPVAGLGFVAVRDTAAWLKHRSDSLAPARFVYAFGASQSGRFLRSFLYEGFNTDERDRPAFDAVFAHIAGVARIDLNRRWSLPRSLGTYSATSFPFSDAAQRDPVSGVSEGLLENPRSKHVPKIFYTNTSVEYWGGGRVAFLGHTDPAGTKDISLPGNVRSYFFAGTQHGPGRFPPIAATAGQQRANPADYWWINRALLTSMHRWVKDGVPPPASAIPSFREGTLVPVAAISFPAIAGVASPRMLKAGARVANLLIAGGAGEGAVLPLAVPQVDADGIERAGVRLPEIAVPLATYTGWNFRSASAGAPGDLVALVGSWIPFPATRVAKESTRDPRRSVEERYASRAEYLAKITAAADTLVQGGYLLKGDVGRIAQRAGEQWDLVTSPEPDSSRRK